MDGHRILYRGYVMDATKLLAKDTMSSGLTRNIDCSCTYRSGALSLFIPYPPISLKLSSCTWPLLVSPPGSRRTKTGDSKRMKRSIRKMLARVDTAQHSCSIMTQESQGQEELHWQG